ncbi:phosphoethanolamine transferase [Pseudomonadota bacterium]
MNKETAKKIRNITILLYQKIKYIIRTPLSRFDVAMLGSIISFVFFNGFIFLERIANPKADLLFTVSEPFVVILITFIFFYVFTQIKIAFRIIVFLFFLTSAIFAFCMYSMNIVLDQMMMITIFATDTGETGELVNSEMVVKMVAWAFIPLMFSLFIKFKKERDFSLKAFKRPIFTILIIAIIPVLLGRTKIYEEDNMKILVYAYLPYNYTNAVSRYFMKTRESLKIVEDKINLFNEYDFELDDNRNEDIIFVLVIGESARRHNFTINGYERNTNPRLGNIDNIVSYQTAISCSRFTQYSVPCIMVRTENNEFKFPMKETSMINILRGLGFDTYWLDIQGAFSSNAMPIFQIASEAHEQIFRQKLRAKLPSNTKLLDEHLLPLIDSALENEERGDRKFIVLHTAGSHYDYDDRYTEEFKEFQPICGGRGVSKCSKQEIINSYDNSIVYTDYFLAEIIERLKKKNAVMIYVSDHAESLGEDGVFLHGTDKHTNRPEQFEIPLIFWASDKFLKDEKNRKMFDNIKEKAVQKIETSHDNIFHSVLDCIGVESDVIDKEMSLCSSITSEVES